MAKRKQLFERVPLHDISHVLGDKKPVGSPPETDSDSLNESRPPASKKPTTIVQRNPLARKTWTKTDEEDHSLLLWLNQDIFRKQGERATQTVIHDPLASTNKRYLALADTALGKNNEKSKSKDKRGRTGNAMNFVGKASERRILHSWKEISSYVGCGVRTVQRYERLLGFPVRRSMDKSPSSVMAFCDEIDQWLEQRPMRQQRPINDRVCPLCSGTGVFVAPERGDRDSSDCTL